MVYLFIGEDSPSKDLQLTKIKRELLKKDTEQFNLDTLYAKELTLKGLQEALSRLPVDSSKRVLVIRDAQALKEESKEFILRYIKAPYKHAVLILDTSRIEKRDAFINGVFRSARVLRFKEVSRPDTFILSRQIELRRPDMALKVLNQILKEGERPERVLGGLRYAWERSCAHPEEMRRRLKSLLNCDLEIKTGKLKPAVALEKLVISLCGLAKPFR